MPGPKNGERPYLAVPEATFWGLFLDLFLPVFVPPYRISSTIPHTQLNFIYFYTRLMFY